MARRTSLRIERRFTQAGVDPYSTIEWSRRDPASPTPTGRWSSPWRVPRSRLRGHRWRQTSWSRSTSARPASPRWTSRATAARPRRQPADRAGDIGTSGVSTGSPAPGGAGGGERLLRLGRRRRRLEDELKYMLANQIASPNSPQWFNTGLHDAYGLTGPAQGFWFIDPETEEAVPSPDAYSRPAPHACFICAVTDDLVNPGGIMDLWLRGHGLYGSGTGSNFLRSEPRTSGCPAAGSRLASCHSSRSAIGLRAPSSRAAPRGEPPRW